MKTSEQIRKDFLGFFEEKGHKIVPSASVIPYEDPTLLFTNAGMNQFKDVFLGTGNREYKRAVDTQKCIRVSGKHNDLEEVGHDGYHHTFFEMLGNWSFGDYYKKEAIGWAWDLLTGKWGLDKKRLWATVFRDDEESFKLWKSETDIDPSHILKFDEKDNFWEMGDTGPCGPCSEIHYDFTSDGCKPDDVNAGIPEVMEIWNLVFIQYNRDTEGKLHDLPAKHVDTGMGFERMVRVLQNKRSNYETDVFLPLINELISITGKDYSGKYEASMNVIADHIRTLTFAIADGAIPSNEGRGYVLRRILRRAARYGRNLDMRKPFIYKLVNILVNTMGAVFPEITEKRKFIEEVIHGEEEGFNETLDRGLVFFSEEIERMKISAEKTFSGDVAFKLHDTYGFPVDLTQLMARELGFDTDVKKFDELMNMQKDRARSAREDIKHKVETVSNLDKNIIYNPYNGFELNTKIVDILSSDNNEELLVSIAENPFYSESGGQVSDTGRLVIGSEELTVINSIKNFIVIKKSGSVPKINDNVTAKIDNIRRESIQRNHSATHVVHEALRRVLGSHVKQMGSYLDDKLLRFDFPHFHKVSENEITEIEKIVNSKIDENIKVYSETMQIETANKIPNVKKFFGEKYGDDVRVVFIDENFSVEFCGGTHVHETFDIGLFKIVKEESISSGTRRIIARTGQGVLDLIDEQLRDIEKIVNDLPDKYKNNFKVILNDFEQDFEGADIHDAELLKAVLRSQESTIISLLDIREKYIEEKKEMEKSLAKEKVIEAGSRIDELINNAPQIHGFKLVTGEFSVSKADDLKEIGDKLREKIGNGVGLLYAVIEGKVSIVSVVSDNLIKEKGLSAGKIAGDVAKILGGGGGGKPHLATAGGKDISKINEALIRLPVIIEGYLKK
jgi:alanyl-tRNA synthetase